MPSPVAATGPDHRDLYVIVIGVILGILAGPAVLGRVAPSVYERLFLGGQEQRVALEKQEHDNALVNQIAASTDASPANLQEMIQQQSVGLAVLKAQARQAIADHLGRLNGVLSSLVMAVLAVMVIETLADPAARGVRARLSMARYALLALWLALELAQPALLRGLQPLYAAVLLALAVIAALVPLGARKPGAPGNAG